MGGRCFLVPAVVTLAYGGRPYASVLRCSPETQNPPRATSWGFDPPPGTTLNTNILCGFSVLQRSLERLRSGCFGSATALRYEIRYRAHPQFFQYLGFVAADLLSAGSSNYARLRNAQRTEGIRQL